MNPIQTELNRKTENKKMNVYQKTFNNIYTEDLEKDYQVYFCTNICSNQHIKQLNFCIYNLTYSFSAFMILPFQKN